jgi:hypothetical protein
MRRTNRLARFHMVSPDRVNWVNAETLTDVFHPAPSPLAGVAGASDTVLAPATWYYLIGQHIHGPVEAQALQELIDRGEVGPDVLVRPDQRAQWSRFDQVDGLRRASPALAPPSPSPAGASKAGLLGLVTAAATAVLLVCGLIAWYASARRTGLKGPGSSGKTAAAAPAPGERSAPKKPERAKEAAAPVAKVEPAAAPAREIMSANVNLPAVSDIPARHDSTDHVLDLLLPGAPSFALRLRGLDDPETKQHNLVAQPAEPGRADSLTIARDPAKGSGTAESRSETSPLARFWIEGSRLHFRWEPNLRRTLIEPAQALRDCILEINGGVIRLDVALRGLWKDPSVMTVQQGSKVIHWERYGRPSRKLAIGACEVKTAAGWEEIPPAGGDPNHRQRFLLGKAGDPPAAILTLSVRLGDDAQTLSPELSPPLGEMKERVLALEKEDKTLAADIDAHNNKINKLNKNLEKLTKARDQGLEMLERAEAGAPASGPAGRMTPEYIRDRIETFYEPEIKKSETELAGLYDRLRTAQRRLGEVKTEIEQQGRRLAQAEAFQKVPIRARLGIVVEGEAIDVAWFGPW